MPFDAIDLSILTELQRDAKLTNVELANRVGLSPSPCLTRVRALESSGVISTYVALLDPESVGATVSVFIQIALERQSEANLDAFEARVLEFAEVMECYLMSGDSDYLLRVLVRDTADFKDFILDRLSKVPGVANIRSSFALKQVKYSTELPLKRIISASSPGSERR